MSYSAIVFLETKISLLEQENSKLKADLNEARETCEKLSDIKQSRDNWRETAERMQREANQLKYDLKQSETDRKTMSDAFDHQTGLLKELEDENDILRDAIENRLRICRVKGEKAIFHKWIHEKFATVYSNSEPYFIHNPKSVITVNNFSDLKVIETEVTYGLVEMVSNGKVKKVDPKDITFLQEKGD